MDPQSEKAPGLHLPKPSDTEGLAFDGKYEDVPQKPEFSAPAPEARGSVLAPPATGSIAAPTMMAPVQPSTSTPPVNAQPAVMPADDAAGDDLDKEWINKAKMIVEKTKEDPYLQSNQIGKVKADYLRIRYNKHIKVGQDQTL
jgi:hypothetical protein